MVATEARAAASLAQDVDTAPQSTQSEEPPPVDPDAGDTPAAPASVNVTEVVRDDQISERLLAILDSTTWFQNAGVEVANGVVFLKGTTSDERYRTWAGDLASKTEDVVAVVNRIRVLDPPLLDLDPAWGTLQQLLRSFVRSLPLLALSCVFLLLTWFASRAAQRLADATILRRVKTHLLREVARKAVSIPVFLLGLFLILRVTGLTQLALTVLGGTGLFGLVMGIAFRDIAENFLASILLSMQNPFRYGDLIEVAGHQGYVQRVNTRGTLLMTLDGNHVQIPNADIFKGTIVNYTSNPNRRFSFRIGIGYDAAVTTAQDTALHVLTEHPAVLDDPEPQVLVDDLGASTINLVMFAWVDGSRHSWAKVRSSVIRLVLKAFADAGLSMPDEQREIVFPDGVPVRMIKSDEPDTAAIPPRRGSLKTEHEAVVNRGEGDLKSDADKLKEQAERSRDPEQDGSVNLLTTSGDNA